MNKRIENIFSELKKEGRKGLVTFVTACDPTREISQNILNLMPESGADIIELGMPFSDPMADGPTIEAANIRALNAGANMKITLEMVRDFRAKNDKTPLILMGYYNPVYQYGVEAFLKDAKEAGVDGLIIVDLPPEESAELCAPASAQDIDIIRLITPTTDMGRLKVILGGASGFLYYVSIAGVTGTKSADEEAVSNHIGQIREVTDLPIAIGFGIKTPEDAARMGQFADAVVVGSAIVENMAKIPENVIKEEDICNQIQALAGGLK